MRWGMLLLVPLTVQAMAQDVHMPLHDDWQFGRAGSADLYPAEVPGVVQTDLLRNGMIPDPYLGSNIDSIQWIENEDWIYRKHFTPLDTLLRLQHIDLVFEGLDTFAEVYLNDSLLGKADNMFRTWQWPVKGRLRSGDNELKVIFRSPIKEGAKLRDAYGIQLPHDNDPSGVGPYIRKAAYQFGWDFCPRMVTSGIWRPVALRGWGSARISSFQVSADPVDDGVAIQLRTYLPLPFEGTVRYSIDGNVIGQRAVGEVDGTGFSAIATTYPSTELWWPVGHGEQHLHTAQAEVLDAKGRVVHQVTERIGFRTIQLIQEPDPIGKSFLFRVNGIDLYIKGCNLVPPSLLLPAAGDAAWVRLVGAAQQAGMNMVRVWSGGVYPPEAFFAACDTAGIMVWQDLMIANMPPGDLAFKYNVMDEASEVLDRIHHHPSLALVCGDNELEVAWANWGWQERYGLRGQDSIRVAESYAELQRVLAVTSNFHRLPYTPTSPLSNWGNADGLRNGDLHYWGVWHGDSTFSSFETNVGRFVSEYGFQSYPDSSLLARYIAPGELYLGSPALSRLQRSYRTDRPIWEAIERELGQERPGTLGAFISASQRVQAKAYGMAIAAHGKARPHCMGTLLWQLNDCWPGPSWSIIDFRGTPKPAFEVVRKAYGLIP